jgi:hypothetical protein
MNADFEIEDDGFDEGEVIQIGVTAPVDSIMSLFNGEIKVHIVAETPEAKLLDPTGVLIALLNELALRQDDIQLMADMGVRLQVEAQ